MESTKEIVVITGITGFIASHIAKMLLEQKGNTYKIRGTLRSKQKSIYVEEALGKDFYN